jgi:hypothetical protein
MKKNKVTFLYMIFGLLLTVMTSYLLKLNVTEKSFTVFFLSALFMFIRIGIFYFKIDDSVIETISMTLLCFLFLVFVENKLLTPLFILALFVILTIKEKREVQIFEKNSSAKLQRYRYFSSLFIYIFGLQAIILLISRFKLNEIAMLSLIPISVLMIVVFINLTRKGLFQSRKYLWLTIIMFCITGIYETIKCLVFKATNIYIFQWIVFIVIYAFYFNKAQFLNFKQMEDAKRNDKLIVIGSFVFIAVISFVYIMIKYK